MEGLKSECIHQEPRTAEICTEQHRDYVNPVAPADFLAASAAARIERHRPLDDAAALAEKLGGDLGLDVETVRLEPQATARQAPP